MTWIKTAFANAKVRLAARALLAAAVYLFSHLSGHRIDHTLLVSALVGAGWAALEVVTPLNALVGWWKLVVKADPALGKYGPPGAPPAATP